MSCYTIAFGRQIRRLRTNIGETQEEIANRAAMHVTYLSGIERGLRNPSLTSIRALAEALEVPIEALFDFDD